MLYFKNNDLAETYHVSVRTVLNWIESAKDGKLALELYTHNSRLYVANTTRNIATIESIVENLKKYRNMRGFKVVSPSPEFYKLFDDEQIFDIISYLETYHEIERQYNYFDGGAVAWDVYAHRLAMEDTPNVLTGTIKLLGTNESYIDDLLFQYKRINIIDIGVGNALPTKGLLGRILARGVLGRYIALDISPKMLEIARSNVEQWFDGKVRFEGHILDINYERFAHLLADEYMKEDAEDTANVVLLLGGTLSNLRAPDSAFKIIHDSMGIRDLLIYTNKLDTPRTRRYFDFSTGPKDAVPPPTHSMMLGLLNIDKSLYTFELGYDKELCARYEQIRFNTALRINFEFAGGQRPVNFNKGDAILIWRAWQQNAFEFIEQFNKNGFYPFHISQTRDLEYLMTIARIRSE